MARNKRFKWNMLATAAVAFTATVVLFGSVGNSLTDTEKYFEQMEVFNEVISEVQLKYVDDEKIGTEDLVGKALEGMLKGLDPHSAYLPPKDYDKFKDDTRGTFGGLGITIDIRDGWLTVVSPLPGTPAIRAGLHANDKIIKIEDESTEGMDIEEAVERLRGEPGTEVTITVFRPSDQSTENYTIERDIIRVPNVYVYTIDDKYGYIRLLEFKQTSSNDIDRALNMFEEMELEGVILDLRFDSGGLLDMAVEISDKFLPRGTEVVSIRGRNEDDTRSYNAKTSAQCKLPLVVLVNQASASASEIVAAAMQDHGRGIVVGPAGKRTFGKGSVQTVIPMSNGGALKLTTAKYYTPLGRSIQDIKGIAPDIEVDIDEQFQINLGKMGRIAYLPEEIAHVKQILPEPAEDEEEESSEESSSEVESATKEQNKPVGFMEKAPEEKAETELPEIYDKELAKALELLKTHKIWSVAHNLLAK